jgi:hypothetical protein
MIVIELKEKSVSGGYVNLIAECNKYEDDVLVKQFSRSPFTFPDTVTDQDIIDSIAQNEYSIYL